MEVEKITTTTTQIFSGGYLCLHLIVFNSIPRVELTYILFKPYGWRVQSCALTANKLFLLINDHQGHFLSLTLQICSINQNHLVTCNKYKYIGSTSNEFKKKILQP